MSAFDRFAEKANAPDLDAHLLLRCAILSAADEIADAIRASTAPRPAPEGWWGDSLIAVKLRRQRDALYRYAQRARLQSSASGPSSDEFAVLAEIAAEREERP